MSDLFGTPEGRKAVETQWGLRYTKTTFLAGKGEVAQRPSEEGARKVCGNVYLGWGDTEVVKRTITTYTTPWESA